MAFIHALAEQPPNEQRAKQLVNQVFVEVLSKHQIAAIYNLLIFFDRRTMIRNDADEIYRAITSFSGRKPILLLLYATGGEISAGYLIGKLCREYANAKFSVVVPRQAKSAATLLCCGADELHMGSLSDLGPIDPQIDGAPTLGLKYAIEQLADLVKRYPAASDMFASYLNKSLPLVNLGYYERIAESAVQYAENLLERRTTKAQKSSREIAFHLVYSYRDHGFVIDKEEAKNIFGAAMVKSNTDEYRLGNELYEAFSLLNSLAQSMNYDLYFVGSAMSECDLRQRRK